MRTVLAGGAGCICRMDIDGHTIPGGDERTVSSCTPHTVKRGVPARTGRVCYLLFPRIARNTGGHFALPLASQHHGVALDAAAAEGLGWTESLPAEATDPDVTWALA